MAVFRVEKSRDFTVMSNYHLKDKELSLKAKGLLSVILSLPDGWNYTTRGLAAICKEGVDSIGGALRELEEVGYILRRRLRDAKGKITDTEYTIYERPQKLEPDTLTSEAHVPNTSHPAIPRSDSSHPTQPHLAQPHTTPPYPAQPDTPHPYTENPYMDNPDTDAPYTDMPAQSNTKVSSTHDSNPQRSNTQRASIHPSIDLAGAEPCRRDRPDWMDRMDEMESYRELIMANIEYDCLCNQYGSERMDEVVELILEVVLSKRSYIRIAGDEFPVEAVKSRLLKVTSAHVQYVFACLDKNTATVRNIKAYTLTALFNAPATMDSYYRAEANRDLYGGDL